MGGLLVEGLSGRGSRLGPVEKAKGWWWTSGGGLVVVKWVVGLGVLVGAEPWKIQGVVAVVEMATYAR